MKIFTTPVPNSFFDSHLVELSLAELKVLLVIVRQTWGWQAKNKKRKQRDWINGSQFIKKTGLSRKAISNGVGLLVEKGLIKVTDYSGLELKTPESRRGIPRLFYEAFHFPQFSYASQAFVKDMKAWKKKLM